LKPIPIVAFICSANLCRSMMAHAILAAETKRRKLAVKILSAGMYDFEGTPAVHDAKLCCERHGTPLVNLVSTYFRSIDLAAATRIMAMTKQHAEMLSQEVPVVSDRIRLLGEFDPQKRGDEIADPLGQSAIVFDACYERLRDCINQYLDSTSELV